MSITGPGCDACKGRGDVTAPGSHHPGDAIPCPKCAPKLAPIIDLDEARDHRTRAAMLAAHARGAAFAFTRRDDLGADDAPIGHAQGFVVILLDALTGLALSPDAARALARHLTEAADDAGAETG